MKKSIMILLAASMLAASVPALAAEHHHMNGHDAKCQRDCEMMVKNCAIEVDSIQQKIQKLQYAIENNAGKYTAQELRDLKDELEDAQTTLANIEHGA